MHFEMIDPVSRGSTAAYEAQIWFTVSVVINQHVTVMTNQLHM